MGTSQFALYNAALRHAGDTPLATVTETREARYRLDEAWGDQFTDFVLSNGFWKWALRQVQMDADLATPAFGYRFAFTLPSDMLITYALTSDPYGNVPLTRYKQINNVWYADIQTFYLWYVSNDAAYGGNLSLWTASFGQYAGYELALRIIPGIAQNEDKIKRLTLERKKWLVDARSQDAMEGPTTAPAMGSWNRARWGGRQTWDRGNLNQLIG